MLKNYTLHLFLSSNLHPALWYEIDYIRASIFNCSLPIYSNHDKKRNNLISEGARRRITCNDDCYTRNVQNYDNVNMVSLLTITTPQIQSLMKTLSTQNIYVQNPSIIALNHNYYNTYYNVNNIFNEDISINNELKNSMNVINLSNVPIDDNEKFVLLNGTKSNFCYKLNKNKNNMITLAAEVKSIMLRFKLEEDKDIRSKCLKCIDSINGYRQTNTLCKIESSLLISISRKIKRNDLTITKAKIQ